MKKRAVTQPLLGSSVIERVIALRSFPGYASLPLGEVEALASAAEDRHVKPGEYLFRAGDAPAEVFFVTSGRVEATSEGRKVRDFVAHSAVGGLAAFAGDTHVYDCVVMENSSFIVLKTSVMLEMFEEHFEIIRTVLAGMSAQMLDLRQASGAAGGFAKTDWQPDGPPPPPLNLIERLSLLRSGMQFAGSKLEAVADIARQCDEVRLDPGDVLWRQDEPAESFVFVVWGVVQTQGGVEARFGPGDVVGFLGPFSGRNRWYTAKAETSLVGLRLSAEVLLDVCEDHTELAMEMVSGMARGLLSVMVASSSA